MTVAEVMEIYRGIHMRNNLKPSTYQSYSVNIDNHILPQLGERDTDSLEYKDIDLFVAKLNSKGLNNTTVRYILKVFKQALSYSVKRQYIRFNIMEVYELPRKNTYNYTILSVDEMVLLLKELLNGDNDIKLIIMFMLCYGMRRGECLGLRYSDLAEDVLSIRRTTQFTGGKFLTTDCKTEKSKRDILLRPEHLTYIETYHRERGMNPEGFLMRRKDGSRITQNILQREFKHILKRLKLPDIRLHDLRHSYATMMVRNGVNPKIISSVLGHSSIGITMDLYSHADVSMQTACLDVVGEKFGDGR